MNLSDNQKKLLNLLLDKYEGSKTYQGTNQVQQQFYVAPEKIWKEYTSDYADIELVKDFENEMNFLAEIGLIIICIKNGEISKLLACNEKFGEYYGLLNRESRKNIVSQQIAFFGEWRERNLPIITPFCKEQLLRIESGKNPEYDIEASKSIFRIISSLISNEDELMVRELSIMTLADSKLFADQYQSKICRIIERYTDISKKIEDVENPKEREKIILEEYGIYENPSYVYVRGDADFRFQSGNIIHVGKEPIAFSSSQLSLLLNVSVFSDKIITVENLTSFHRMRTDDCFCIYLAGYHNTAKQKLIKNIFITNQNKKWLHFGDIDPDGFYILEHLRSETGIDFEPYKMGLKELKTFREYGKKLEGNDLKKAHRLLHVPEFQDVISYMLDNDCKLEQEIVSWYM